MSIHARETNSQSGIMRQRLLDFMLERERIRDRKDSGQPFPWTDDPILQKYFISNLDCEDDKTTRWLKKSWPEPYQDDPDLPFAIAVFRRGINLPATAEQLGYPVPWDVNKFLQVIQRRQNNKLPWCNPHAYKLIVGHRKQDGGFHGPQHEMLVHYVFDPVWQKREVLRVQPASDSLESYYQRVSKIKFMGGWYTYRLIVDLKYTKQLRNAPDWQTWLLLGPGTIRGLNRVLGRNINTGVFAGNGGVVLTLTKEQERQFALEVNQLIDDLAVRIPAHVID
jgi:hypothetical protein